MLQNSKNVTALILRSPCSPAANSACILASAPPLSELLPMSGVWLMMWGTAAATNSAATTSSVHFWCDKAADGSCDYGSSSVEFSRSDMRGVVRNGGTVPRASPADASTIKNKVLAGYQGWAGARSTWDHWSKDGKTPSAQASNAHFEMVPQAGEYPSNSLHDTGFKYSGNGSVVRLYENAADGVVDLHFRWMADYGLDGVLIQRFIVECTTPGPALTQRNTILRQVDAAASAHGRAYAMMWDMSGASAQWDADIKTDWNKYVRNYTSNPQYLKEGGRPVVCIFGIGLVGHEKATPNSALALIRWLQAQGLYVIGSGPYWWRTGGHDALGGFEEVHAAFDAIMPWAVGRYNTASDFHAKLPLVVGDAKLTSGRGQGYAPIAYPGYSYRDDNKINFIKRYAGKFMSAQTDAYLKVQGATFYYIAMFDEVQEGTAIYKFAANERESAAGATFVTASIDGVDCPGDMYLTLAGQYAAAAKGGPTPPPPPPMPPTPGADHLLPGGSLKPGEHLVSAKGIARLEMQGSDGNLVLYADHGAKAIWSSNTSGNPGAHLDFQGSDGNLVLYDEATTHVLWSTGPQDGAARVVLQDDCNLVTTGAGGAVLWALGKLCG